MNCIGYLLLQICGKQTILYGIVAPHRRSHNAAMFARSAWNFLATKPLRWILLLAFGVGVAGLALFP